MPVVVIAAAQRGLNCSQKTFRLMLEDITGPYAAAHALPTARRGSDGLLQMLLSNNSVGIRLRETLIAANSGVVPLKGRIQTDLAATLVIVAIKAFKMKTGRLPKTLDELVPEYLAAVPLDDFDGKPLRYSPEKKILYSVGKNLKDVGGSTKEEIQKWCEKEYPSQPPEDTYSVSVPVWNLPNPSWPIEF